MYLLDLKGPQDMLQYYQAAYNEALETYALEQIGNRRRDEYQDGEVRAQLNVKPPSSCLLYTSPSPRD